MLGQALDGIESVLSASGYDLLVHRVGDPDSCARFGTFAGELIDPVPVTIDPAGRLVIGA